MDITGLTGHSGSGKTTVAKIMAEHGFHHIDCDKVVHHKVYKNALVLNEIADVFGSEYVLNGELQRKALGALVFSNKQAYANLMEIVQKHVTVQIDKEIKENSDKHILLDAPALFEYGIQGICSRIIGVVSDNAVERICARDGISEVQAKNRLNNQKDYSFYKENCDILIENNCSIEELENKVINIAKQILKGQ